MATAATKPSDTTPPSPAPPGARRWIEQRLHLDTRDPPLAAFNDLQIALGFGQSDSKVDSSRMIEGAVTGLVTVVTPAAVQFLIQLVLFFGTLFFFIIGRSAFRSYFVSWFSTREAR